MSDMGAFDENGVWQWDSEFQALVSTRNWSPWSGDWNQMTPFPNTETVVEYGRFDNKRYPNGEINHRLGGLAGFTGGTMFPSVWKMQVKDPAGFPGEVTWEPQLPTIITYPFDIVHVDWEFRPECQALCDSNGCPFDDGSAPDPDGDGPQLPCSWGYDWDGDGLPDNGVEMNLFADITRDKDGEERLSPDNVSHIVLNGQTELPSYMELGTYSFLSYNTDNNSQDGSFGDTYYELYFEHYPDHIPMGPQVAVLHMKDGTIINLPFEVKSDRVMPTVAAFNTVYQNEVLNKSGKAVKGLSNTEIQVSNLTARELDGQLIIQWAEPDGAFQAPLLNTGGIRLKMWVGDMNNPHLQFLFIDAPVMTGTIVVPANKWSEIKGLMIAAGRTTVNIGGFYREEFRAWIGFHNRGYFESIEYTF